MISNERQLQVSSGQLEALEARLAELQASNQGGDETATEFALIEQAGLQGTAARLRAEIDEYRKLRSGDVPVVVNSLSELPSALIKARIARGLTQRELAERLGLKEQQIQRYEAHMYQSANLARVLRIAEELGLSQSSISVPSQELLVSRLEEFGVGRSFLMDRLLSPRVADQVEVADLEESALSVVEAFDEVERILGWSPATTDAHGDRYLSVHQGARFKLPRSTNLTRILPYVSYTRFLMQQLASAARDLPQTMIPSDPAEISKQLRARGGLTFESGLAYVWDLGIPILPLSDPGKFHGMWLRTDGRDVIALKQRTDSLSRWLFDLLHELRHAQRSLEHASAEIVEFGEPSTEGGDDEEADANWFATEVILDGRADDLFVEVWRRAEHRVEYVKNAVSIIASANDVPVGALANHVAYRLGHEGINWWGAAQNLQERDNPVRAATAVLLARLQLDVLDDHARSVLLASLEPQAA